jgi:hypothetical protein
MKFKPESNCPLNNFDPCKTLECAWFIQILGTNPNNGAEVDEWGCAQAWLPILIIENSKQQRQTGIAIESFRNEMVKANENSQKILLTAVEANHQLHQISDEVQK